MTWPVIQESFVMDSTIQNFANAVLIAGGKSKELSTIANKAKTLMKWGSKEQISKKFKKWTNRYKFPTPKPPNKTIIVIRSLDGSI